MESSFGHNQVGFPQANPGAPTGPVETSRQLHCPTGPVETSRQLHCLTGSPFTPSRLVYSGPSSQMVPPQVPQVAQVAQVVPSTITQPDNQTLRQILGQVIKDNKVPEGKSLLVLDEESQRKVTVMLKHVHMIPAVSGDIIRGVIRADHREQYSFIEKPRIIPAVSEDNVKRFFMMALSKSKAKRLLVDRLYDFFTTKTREIIKEASQQEDADFHRLDNNDRVIYQKRGQIASAIFETAAVFLADCQNNIVNRDLLQDTVELDDNSLNKLIRWSTYSFGLRRLYGLGCDKDQVYHAIDRGYTMTTLYQQLITNPYAVESIPLSLAKEISTYFELTFPPAYTECGHIIREIDRICTANGYTSFPLEKAQFLFGQQRLAVLRPILEQNFFCVFHDNPHISASSWSISLRYQYVIEQELIKTISCGDELGALPATHCSHKVAKLLDPYQLKAVDNALTHRLSCIIGGAGTGKSRTIMSVAQEFVTRGLFPVICSFTGKAVARLKELDDNKFTIVTIHKLLNMALTRPPDVVIVDEASMVDNQLAGQLIQRCRSLRETYTILKMKDGKRPLQMVLVGDPKQLDPIKAGEFFGAVLRYADIGKQAKDSERVEPVEPAEPADSESSVLQPKDHEPLSLPVDNGVPPLHTTLQEMFVKRTQKPASSGPQYVPVTRLMIDHRRTMDSGGSGLLRRNIQQFEPEENASGIELTRRTAPFLDWRWSTDLLGECVFVQGDATQLRDLLQAYQAQGIITKQEEIKIVCPYREPLHELNEISQNIWLTPEQRKDCIRDSFGKIWYNGSLVMMKHNRYDIDVMNGDEGTIVGIDIVKHCIEIAFANGRHIIPCFTPPVEDDNTDGPFREDYLRSKPLTTQLIDVSYATTVHSSQGSEWDNVLFYLPPRPGSGFVNWKLIYTAITRSRKKLIVVGPSQYEFMVLLQSQAPDRFDPFDQLLLEHEQRTKGS